MKKIFVASLMLAVASCASKPVEKVDLGYKVFPKTASTTYEFDLAVPKVHDARITKFILGNDNYFDEPIVDSLTELFFEEIRASSAFNSVSIVENKVDFNPTSSQIQDIKRTSGKDAVFLVKINKFNANVRKLSDEDKSNLVNLKVFTNITYKIVLADSETVVFLTTQDTSTQRVVALDENIHKAINELAINNIKNNIINARNEFISTSKATLEQATDKADDKVSPVPAVVAPIATPEAKQETKVEEKTETKTKTESETKKETETNKTEEKPAEKTDATATEDKPTKTEVSDTPVDSVEPKTQGTDAPSTNQPVQEAEVATAEPSSATAPQAVNVSTPATPNPTK